MTTTTNKGYTLPTVGADFGTWGTELNSNLSIQDSNLGGVVTVNVAGNSNVTANASQAQNLITILTGALTGNIQYILPATGGIYVIQNSTSGSFSVTISSSGGGTTVALPQGTILTFVCDATNIALANQGFVQANSAATLTSLTTTGNVSVGGTLTVTGVLTTNGAVTMNQLLTLAGTPNPISAPAGTSLFNALSVSGGVATSVSGWFYNSSGGTVGNPSSGTPTIGVNVTQQTVSTGNWVISDVRFKTGIETISVQAANALVRTLRPVTYMKHGTAEAGFIAQEVVKAGYGHLVATIPHEGLPELKDEDGFVSKADLELALNPTNPIPYLLACLQGLLERVDALENGYVR